MKDQNILIGFIGMTHLGLNSAVVGANLGFKIVAYDENIEKIRALANGKTDLTEPELKDLLNINKKEILFTFEKEKLSLCDVLYISADVQTDDSGNSDLSLVTKYINLALETMKPEAVLVILSQVPPGFTRRYSVSSIKLYYQVETLIFGQAIHRASEPERYIIGASDSSLPLPNKYKIFLDAHGEPPIYQMNYESAELAKISINCFLAATVSTTNMLAELCEGINAKWDEILPTLRLDRRIGEYAYLNPGLGLSGGNIERDINTVIKLGKKSGSNIDVPESWLTSSKHRNDWCFRLVNTIIEDLSLIHI